MPGASNASRMKLHFAAVLPRVVLMAFTAQLHPGEPIDEFEHARFRDGV